MHNLIERKINFNDIMAPPFYPSADLPTSSESMLNIKHSFTIEHMQSIHFSWAVVQHSSPQNVEHYHCKYKICVRNYIPPWDTRSTRRGCWPHQTSSRDIDARNNPWSAVSWSEVTSGRSCTLQLVWTENILPPHAPLRVSGLFRCEVITLCNT